MRKKLKLKRNKIRKKNIKAGFKMTGLLHYGSNHGIVGSIKFSILIRRIKEES